MTTPTSRDVPPPAAVQASAALPRPRQLRVGLRRLSRGLLVYGAIGLTFAIVGLLALLWVGGRVGGLADRVGARVESITGTLDDTAQVLDDAAATAISFAATIERTPPTVHQAAQTVGNLQDNLRTLEAQLGTLSILGQTPLAGASRVIGEIATELEGLDTRLELIATDLEGNRDALLANAESLDALGERLAAIAEDLRGGVVEDSLADVQLILTTLALLLVVWTAIPAVGALGLGWWLRREIG